MILKSQKINILALAFLFLNVPMASQAMDEQALLIDLLAVPSGTSTISGVKDVLFKIDNELKTMGFQTEMKAHPSDPDAAPLLVGTFLGKKPHYITFVLHADTVFENANTEFKELDGKLYGPGVIDDKGSVVVALMGIADFLQTNATPAFSMRVVVSPAEETGSAGFIKDFQEYSQDSFMVLGFEPALDDGSLVESRRGNRWYKITVKGKEAHAGRAHKQGINACHELAIKIDQLQKLTDYSKDLTVNIGHIEGGKDKYNIVCGEAIAKIDTRFGDLLSREALHAKIVAILNNPVVKSYDTKEPTQITYTIEDDTPPFAVNAATKMLLEKYKSIISKIEGKPVLAKKSGGAADTNHFSRPGLILIDGLGAVGGKMHTEEEFLILSSLSSRAQALTEFLLSVP